MFSNQIGKSKDNQYFAKGCISLFIPFLFIVIGGIIEFPKSNTVIESRNLAALQERGISTRGCVVELIDVTVHAGHDYSDKLVYAFQIPQGQYTGTLKIAPEYLQQIRLGDCYEIVYLPDNPAMNRLRAVVSAYSPEKYWSDYRGSTLPIAITFTVIAVLYLIVVYIVGLFRREKRKA